MITPVKKFWLYDPPRLLWNNRLRKRVLAKGHPRVLVAWRLLANQGLVEYATATWNPSDGLPFRRKFAHDHVEGLMRGNHVRRVPIHAARGWRWSILYDMLLRATAVMREDTARYRAARAAFDQLADSIPPTDRNVGAEA